MSNVKNTTDTIDLSQVPFSYHQSFFALSLEKGPQGTRLLLRDVRGGDLDPGHLFELKLPESGDYAVSSTEACLTVTLADLPLLQFAFEDGHSLRVLCLQASAKEAEHRPHPPLALEAIPHGYNTMAQLAQDSWEFTSYFKELKLRFQLLQHKQQPPLSPLSPISQRSSHAAVIAQWQGTKHDPIALPLLPGQQWLIQSYTVAPRPRTGARYTFEGLVRRNQREFLKWWLALDGKQAPSSRQAAHALWQNFVPKGGRLQYPALYMTKNWMTNIWSWDNCFSALGLAHFAPKLALEQLLIFESLQSPEGALPDFANDRYASYSSLKPPLLGLTLTHLADCHPDFKTLKKATQRQLYQMVARQTAFWLNYRQSEIGLPYYCHGNDSGWDNGTFFSEGVPVITPDLATFLILQMDYLIAHAPIKPSAQSTAQPPVKAPAQEGAAYWRYQQERLLTLLLTQLWDGRQFGAIKWPEGWRIAPPNKPSTLQALLPLLLGQRLPQAIRTQLLEDLKAFEGNFGLATEALDSPHYKTNGYWRGPIWAPTTYLMISALEACHQPKWAQRIAKKYLNLVDQSGLAENFDPITGEGLVDTGFAWTAAVYSNLLRRFG